MPNSLWFVYSNPKSPERDEEYNNWMNTFHLQQVMKVPGFEAATRYRVCRTQFEWMPPMGRNPEWPHGLDQYLTIFEVDRHADPAELFKALRESENERLSNDPENDPVEWGEQWFYEVFSEKETSVELKPAPPRPDAGPPYHLWIVLSTPLSDDIAEANHRWYTSQMNLRFPGFETCVRLNLSKTQGRIDTTAATPQGEWPHGRHTYLAVWEISDLHEAMRHRRMAQVTNTAFPNYPWMQPIRELRRGGDHVIYEPVTNRVTPIWTARHAR